MSTTDTDQQWVIVRDDAESAPNLQYLSEDQEWGPIEIAMTFSTEKEAANGAETLCPAFMPGHPERVNTN